ncbi:MAG: hypothetical protein ACRD36_08875 [Candidatus Acidiferrum sp.]
MATALGRKAVVVQTCSNDKDAQIAVIRLPRPIAAQAFGELFSPSARPTRYGAIASEEVFARLAVGFPAETVVKKMILTHTL